MKITFIVPSSQWLTAAGVRIRYKRLEPSFYEKGCHISITPLQDVTKRCIQESDVVIVSKIFSTDSLPKEADRKPEHELVNLKVCNKLVS